MHWSGVAGSYQRGTAVWKYRVVPGRRQAEEAAAHRLEGDVLPVCFIIGVFWSELKGVRVPLSPFPFLCPCSPVRGSY